MKYFTKIETFKDVAKVETRRHESWCQAASAFKYLCVDAYFKHCLDRSDVERWQLSHCGG